MKGRLFTPPNTSNDVLVAGRHAHPHGQSHGAEESTSGVAFGDVISTAPTTPVLDHRYRYGTQLIEQVTQRANLYITDVAGRLYSR